MTNVHNTSHPRIKTLVALATLSLSLGWTPSTTQSASAAAVSLPASMPFADSTFERVWMRNDQPVASRAIARSWTWGPAPLASGVEPYAEATDGTGTRLVQYFD